MARVFVTRDLPGDALGRLREEHDIDLWEGDHQPPADEIQGREALLTMVVDPVTAEVIGDSPELKAIANYGVGTDNVDLDAATARGIPVGNTPDVLTETTAELAFALMMAAARRLTEADRYVRDGDWAEWKPDLLLGRDLHGSTLGVVGYGRIGTAFARMAEGFEMEVIHTARSGGVPLDELLERSDFVSIHAPLRPETRGLIGERELGLMKPTAILINTARGPLVDTDAVTKALQTGQIGGAALDVSDPEPLPADHPLLQAPNLVIAPHIGSASHRTREAMADMAVDNLLAALKGDRMPHCANPAVYDA